VPAVMVTVASVVVVVVLSVVVVVSVSVNDTVVVEKAVEVYKVAVGWPRRAQKLF